MAINFEAANMAGYNNPKIEVFPAALTDEGELRDAPPASIIVDCINRGSIPFLSLTTADRVQTNIFTLTGIVEQPSGGPEICFTAVTEAEVLAIRYYEGSVTLSMKELPVV